MPRAPTRQQATTRPRSDRVTPVHPTGNPGRIPKLSADRVSPTSAANGRGPSMLPETIRRVDELVATTQSTGRVPSLVAGIVRDGALVHVSGAGEVPVPDAGTQYRIGSISKTFTAALIVQLRDEDRLSLDDLLYRHLPGTPVGGVTIRQLLAHIGGLQREPDGDWWERSAGQSVDGLLAELTPDKAALPLHGFHYSNLAYGLLGA